MLIRQTKHMVPQEQSDSQRSTALEGAGGGYLHGFDGTEQERLYTQARFLDPYIFARLELAPIRNLLEVGCGVGAMTERLLRRLPEVRITAIDISEKQIARAREHLAKLPEIAGRTTLRQMDASRLEFDPPGQFDGAFLCWVLEHVKNPEIILAQVRNHLASGGRVFITEVMNRSLYVHPRSAALEAYWSAFNAYQEALGGDPYVGAKLGDLLQWAGFGDIRTWVHLFQWDAREPVARAAMFDYWSSLLLSAAGGLVQCGAIAADLPGRLARELAEIRNDPHAIFFYTFVQASAVAPG